MRMGGGYVGMGWAVSSCYAEIGINGRITATAVGEC